MAANEEDCEDILGSGIRASRKVKNPHSIDLAEKNRTKETSQGEATIQEENKDKMEKA